MHIAIDSNVFTTQKYGGVSRYLVNLSKELTHMGHHVEIHGCFHINRHLKDSSAHLTRMRYIDHFPRNTRRLSHYAGDLLTNYQLARHRPSLIHESYCHNRRVGSVSLPRVCTVHDMIYELYPEIWGRMDRTPEYRKSTVNRCQAIICVSESTKRDLLRILDLDPAKVHVIHHGFEHSSEKLELDQNEAIHLQNVTASPFLLYVGSRNPYKNFGGFLKGFAKTSFANDLDVVAFGGGSLSPAEHQNIAQLGFKPGQIRQITGSDALLQALYQKAEAFVYPSLYEGFGFPPLEAMVQGCPVISSNTSSMPEVIGDAAEFFDPTQTDSITVAIESVITSETRRTELVESGKKRVLCFPWSKCAKSHEAIYQSLC